MTKRTIHFYLIIKLRVNAKETKKKFPPPHGFIINTGLLCNQTPIKLFNLGERPVSIKYIARTVTTMSNPNDEIINHCFRNQM